MEFKHSPAPWHLRDGINEHSILVDDNYNVIFASLDDIKKEDADLIEAAPELLALLMKLDRIGGLGLSTHKEIQTVIAKALGQ
ncbi:hypothetical protein [Providencia alcalifaciens]|uniref:hypothetical protein n=1 Tax=Providencia alcalifaciens TaxID=126385 RepID=UPI00044DFBFE|nr:hypothetical protein [Providencia alcalifaciens]EUD08797.1 hypothetical protein HMPREF1564_3584 [Providencia alcalifaciens R90-1475]